VREGAIVPRGDIVKVNNNWDQDWKARLRIEYFPAEKAGSEFLYYTGSVEQNIKAQRTKEGLAMSRARWRCTAGKSVLSLETVKSCGKEKTIRTTQQQKS
jgi:hypothetical protein